ncbi:hypothetical protein B0A49_02293 [Cryomyces minteri]|uniref:DUF726-domain-containing protein n=1 Tax=Cryomyces minteri TaxID=331657 RepID=A0A4V5NHA5_9PEZI|nr:hypothetical protein B0A49_02293 [Cryomyces minteri]
MPDDGEGTKPAARWPETPATTTINVRDESAERATLVEDAVKPDPEIDEFGLPVKKPRRPAYIEDESGDEAGGNETGDLKAVAVAEKEQASEQPSKNSGEAGEPPGSRRSTEESAQGSNRGRAQENAEVQPVVPGTCPILPSPATLEASTAETETPTETNASTEVRNVILAADASIDGPAGATASEWSHQQLVPQSQPDDKTKKEVDEWQEMPAFAPFDLYDDDGKLVAREATESDDEAAAYGGLGGAGKGYTRVQIDEDAQSATSMDENTAYLFKENGTNVADEDEDGRDPLAQMQATKDLLTEGQRIAYVGVTRLAMIQMAKELEVLERTKGAKKGIDLAVEAMQMWSQKMMVRLYSHMEIDAAEQIMIEQLAEHGVQPEDLTPVLMHNARVKNPVAEDEISKATSSKSPPPESSSDDTRRPVSSLSLNGSPDTPPPPYDEHGFSDSHGVRMPSQLPTTKSIDIDLRWTVLCDLFLVLIADSVYDSRSRTLLERVGTSMSIPWLEICRFEKRVTDVLEMQEAANKENWNEDVHMETRKKSSKKKRLVMMGLATVGGGLVIGLSAGLLAPVIGAGLAAGFTTIGVAGTSGFLAGAGGAGLIATTGALSGGAIAVRATNRRMGAVKTFEYRPLHNNKRVNLIVTVAGWMNGKIDDVRLPYSTVDPIMGDIYSVFWEPEMLQSMGDTINILATEALTQGLQQILGSTLLIALMASLQLPLVLTKLSYLIDNPWTVSLARADLAGLILADSLIDRNLGVRPITLVGFSLGSRVILSCLRELANKAAFGLIQNVYLFGSPMVAKKDEYLRARTVVSGRFVNAYATNDWILGYLFRATSGGISRVAGLASVDIPGIENIDVTALVPGHMAYRSAMPRLLREVGWLVESDEFAEIEDPDPDNHDKRQRELINEIEEARKALEKKPEKRGFKALFARNKKLVEKKEWETYDERTKVVDGAGAEKGKDHAHKDSLDSQEGGGVLFDVDAIRAEAAELAALSAHGIEIKEIKSTLPPLRLDSTATSSLSANGNASPYHTLRSMKSYDAGMALRPKAGDSTTSLPVPNGNRIPDRAQPQNHPATQTPPRPSAQTYDYDDPADHGRSGDDSIRLSFDTASPTPSYSSYHPSPAPSYLRSPNSPSKLSHTTTAVPEAPAASEAWGTPSRPPLRGATSTPAGASGPATSGVGGAGMGTGRASLASAAGRGGVEHNAWADDDDDDFGREEGVSMTFE